MIEILILLPSTIIVLIVLLMLISDMLRDKYKHKIDMIKLEITIKEKEIEIIKLKSGVKHK